MEATMTEWKVAGVGKRGVFRQMRSRARPAALLRAKSWIAQHAARPETWRRVAELHRHTEAAQRYM